MDCTAGGCGRAAGAKDGYGTPRAATVNGPRAGAEKVAADSGVSERYFACARSRAEPGKVTPPAPPRGTERRRCASGAPAHLQERNMKRIGVALYLATLAAAALPSAAHAQGFGLNEIGSCAIGRGFAVTGSPCRDASTIYWNPAAATSVVDGVSVLVGGAAIALDGQFQADVTGRVDKANVPTAVPPHLFVNWKQSPRLALGVGAYV